jgi:hypothetical protein
MSSANKCAHPACNCQTADGQKHCSEVCADAQRISELTCQCQHAACLGKELKP